MLKKTLSIFLTFIVLSSAVQNIYGAEPLVVEGKSAVLMEVSTGKVLFEQNPDEALPPASITKVMTLLIIYDSVDSGKIKWSDKVTVSEHAASMGGSQIFLEPNEVQTVEVLTKSIAIASANDAAVAMAEYIGGSEATFVELMNEKAKELGMKTAHFENACGLDTDGHLMSARDIAIMSCELIRKHPEVQKYTTTWQDTITHTTKKGTTEFGLTNTNKLIKQYNDATGLKTGSTGKALYCLSGTAKRDGMELCAVVMAAPDPKARFRQVMNMLDYGFANYTLAKGDKKGSAAAVVQVGKGEEDSVNAIVENEVNIVIPKGSDTGLTKNMQFEENIQAPVKKGDKLGEIIYYYDNKQVGKTNIVAEKTVEKAVFLKTAKKVFEKWVA